VTATATMIATGETADAVDRARAAAAAAHDVIASGEGTESALAGSDPVAVTVTATDGGIERIRSRTFCLHSTGCLDLPV